MTVSRGNMYEWVTHCHSHLRGGCPHDCPYCYVKSFRNYVRDWSGPVRLVEKELGVRYGDGKTIFIEHCNDLFAEGVPDEFVSKILAHTCQWEENTYLFQSKNPARMWKWYECEDFPPSCIIGTTIETNFKLDSWWIGAECRRFTKAPNPEERYHAMLKFAGARQGDCNFPPKLMVTIEPIMEFDTEVLSRWIIDIKPDFINIGADSKHHDLPEPTRDQVLELVKVLEENGVHVNKKTNLERLTG